jgi:hypothetical protein
MRVLVACESSGVVRRAFRAAGHEAYSCDLLPADDGSPYHVQGDARGLLYGLPVAHENGSTDWGPWDLLIAHPPCTYLTNSGVRWLTTIPAHPARGVKYGHARREAMKDAACLFADLWHAPIPRIAIENPIMHAYAREAITQLGVPDYAQTIQPWQFGHGETKRTCLWLKGLPPLQPTNIVDGREGRVWKMPPSADRWKLRSVTYEGIAAAMAAQWGGLIDG